MEKLLTVTQSAERLGLSSSRIRDFIYGGRLKATKFGPMWLIKPKDLAAFARIPRATGKPPGGGQHRND